MCTYNIHRYYTMVDPIGMNKPDFEASFDPNGYAHLAKG